KFAVVTDGKHEYEAAGFTHTVSKDSVVGTWAYDVADKLPALAKEAAEKKPAAILFAGKSEELLRWLRVDAVAKVPVLFSDDEDRLVWPQAAPPGATIYSLTAFSALDDSPALKEFVGKYQERFGEAPDAAAALAYDDARLLFEAIRRAKSVEPAKLCA